MSPSQSRAPAPRRAALALALAACAAAALAPASVASGPSEGAASGASRHPASRSVHVTGEFIAIDDAGTYRLTGGLMGTWYTLTADTYYQSKAMIIQKGLERFEGCLDLNGNRHCDKNRKGKISMDYMYWATFNPKTGRLVKGECIHPITAGKGVFSGTRGFINVNDKPVGKNGVVSTYEGELVLNAVPRENAPVSNAPASLSAAASVATC
jgi:hypothetical protein